MVQSVRIFLCGAPKLNRNILRSSITCSLACSIALTFALTSVASWGQSAPQSYVISTIAGNATGGFSGDGGAATAAELNSPLGLALSGGTLYIADQGNAVVRALSVANGTISTFAGVNVKGYAGDGSAATKANLSNPSGVAIGPNGTVYIADASNNVIRAVASNGNISTVAGSFVLGAGYGGDTALATAGMLNLPYGVLVDASSNIYIADANNNRIRLVTASNGFITTFAGVSTAEYAGDGGPATAAWINHPEGMAFDAAGNLYFADTENHVIRKITLSTGIITTVAGNNTPAFAGDGGPATAASLYRPSAIAFDGAGNMYIADTFNERIRMVLASNGTIHTIAGTGGLGYAGDGSGALTAEFRFPQGIAVDASGNVYVSDNQNNVIRKLAPQTVQAGTQPAINTNGIISASGFAVTPTSTPGGWVEIYGMNFSASAVTWQTSNFSGTSAPTSLNGVSVTVGGQPAFISYVSPGQVNALIPSGTPTGVQPVIVTTPVGSSAPYPLTLNALQPELAAPSVINMNGTQYVAAFFTNGQIDLPINDPVNARIAKSGDVLTFYGIGFGALTPEADAGGLVSTQNTLASTFQISFGGIPATVLYAGTSPTFIGQSNFNTGLYQFNVLVPKGVPPGNAVQVTFSVTTPSTTLNGVITPGTTVNGKQTLFTAVSD